MGIFWAAVQSDHEIIHSVEFKNALLSKIVLGEREKSIFHYLCSCKNIPAVKQGLDKRIKSHSRDTFVLVLN